MNLVVFCKQVVQKGSLSVNPENVYLWESSVTVYQTVQMAATKQIV